LLDFGMRDIPSSKAQRLWKLQNLLLQGQREGKVSALIVDEAHKLSPEVLEEIRLLGNFEEADQKLLQIILVGQTEFDEILNREDLRQLKQRVGVRLSIGPLTPPEVGQYIRHRWLRAGGTQPPFSANAIADIADISRGVPRLINSVCENALTLAFAEGSSLVEPRHVQSAAADLRLRPTLVLDVAQQPSLPEPAEVPEEAVSMWARWIGKLKRSPEATSLLGPLEPSVTMTSESNPKRSFSFMKIDIQKLDDRIKKLQEIRRIAADSELVTLLLEFMTNEETVPEPVLVTKPADVTISRADNVQDMVNGVVNGTASEVRDGLWSRRK
jgi:hypothetical protein